MPNIRVDVGYTIKDGAEIKFRSPVDCSAVTGLVVYYPMAEGNTGSKVFAFADAHGNNVGDIDHLFAENVVVKVILDVTTGMAFVQNADTNAYLEAQLASKAPVGYGYGDNIKSYNWTEDEAAFNNELSKIFNAMPDDCVKQILCVDASINLQLCACTLTRSSSTRGILSGVDIQGNRIQKVIDGTVQPWEWVNPPMMTGVEYRTTERYNGLPVYTRVINCGTLDVGTWKTHDFTGATGGVIRYSGMCAGTAIPFQPFPVADPNNNITLGVTPATIYISKGTTTTINGDIYVQVWYIK